MAVVTFILLALAATVDGVDRKRMTETPAPATNFDIYSWVKGEWFIQARSVSCSFSGSRTFTDMRVTSVLEDKLVKNTFTWRSDVCSSVTFRLTSDVFGCGAFVQKDALGGMATGDHVVVVYKPSKGYDVNWGCTKRGTDGRCSDASVWVKTRHRFPGQDVWQCVQDDLKRLWDMSLTEMTIVSHDNPC